MKAIVRYEEDFGRMGELSGLFILDNIEDLHKVIGQTVHLGECLGKHSDMVTNIQLENFEVLSSDQEFIEKFIKIIGSDTISGINPIEILLDQIMESQI